LLDSIPHHCKDTGDISEVGDTHKGDSVILSDKVIMIVMAGREDLEMNEDSEPLQRQSGLVFFTFPKFGIPKKVLIQQV